MTTLAPLFSSKSDEWATPPEIFNPLHEEFGFTVDVCASPENAKCPVYFTKAEDGLLVPWGGPGARAWCNPPYTKGQARPFVEKALHLRRDNTTTVLLLPARTDTKLFHDLLWDRTSCHPRTGVELRFLKGRITFVGGAAPAPFPSMIAVIRGEEPR